MSNAFKYLTSVLFVAIVVQAALAGYRFLHVVNALAIYAAVALLAHRT
jgi:purine-cytosine permease-like protein